MFIALLAGCGTQHADDAPPAPPAGAASALPERVALSDLPEAPVRGLAKGLTLPLDRYATGPVDAFAWQVAVQEQWRSCMARYGFQDFGPPPVSVEATVTQANVAAGRRYGISDLESAKKYGYHLPDDIPEAPHWEPAPGAESDVFTGAGTEVEGGSYKGKAVPSGGCRGEARRMFPVPQTPEAQKLGTVAFDASRKDPVVTEAVAKWSSCMKKKGYDHTHPLEDLDKFGISLSSSAAGPEEIAHAVADVECKANTSLIKAWNAEESREQESIIKQNAQKLTDEKSVKDTNALKARQAYEKAAKR
ncbi:hypothetical protein [Streptomyces sp. NPDC088757]|uniref:hypothetical protein n=1 Tax=Streptomyces sp. NPDC088757 TaxID=3365889 RepID=UPI00382F313F